MITLLLLAGIVMLPFILTFDFIRNSLEPIIGLTLAKGVAYGAFIALGAFLLVRVVRGLQDQQAMMEWAIQRERAGEDGLFTQWWLDVGGRHLNNADEMRIGEAVKGFIASYGGGGVLRRLENEGFEELILRDAATVLGTGRMSAFLPVLHEKMSRGAHPVSALLGFLVGANIAYNAGRR
ncbi:hypothetical protein [Brevundimonas sp.]|uniref:hypothetical protein n=1 Tax=Brevundimonas sp. TaxID=1871086 RepID=UPI002635489D|nr:hypothetical protein [Brevundimonas sp.]